MKRSIIVVSCFLALIIGGCAVPDRPRQTSKPTMSWHFKPQLSVLTPLQLYVQDTRPSDELASPPSAEYLYSGSIFAVQGNAKTIAEDLGTMAVRFGGAQVTQLVETSPPHGPAISFTLEHWYSRTELKPKKAPLVIRGSFSGVVMLLLDGQVLASRRIQTEGVPSVVDMYIVFDSEKRETPRMIRTGMERTANSSQQQGYAEIASFLQENWHLLQTTK